MEQSVLLMSVPEVSRTIRHITYWKIQAKLGGNSELVYSLDRALDNLFDTLAEIRKIDEAAEKAYTDSDSMHETDVPTVDTPDAITYE